MDGNKLFDSHTGVDYKKDKTIKNTPGKEIWIAVKAHLASILNTADYDRWIDGLRLAAEFNGEIVIAARDPLSFDRVHGAHRHTIQRIWREHGLLRGGAPVFDESREPVLANEKLRDVVASAEKEADFLVKLLCDEQFAADESLVSCAIVFIDFALQPSCKVDLFCTDH